VRSEARKRRHENDPGWTWHHLAILAAVFVALGTVVWAVANP